MVSAALTPGLWPVIAADGEMTPDLRQRLALPAHHPVGRASRRGSTAARFSPCRWSPAICSSSPAARGQRQRRKQRSIVNDAGQSLCMQHEGNRFRLWFLRRRGMGCAARATHPDGYCPAPGASRYRALLQRLHRAPWSPYAPSHWRWTAGALLPQLVDEVDDIRHLLVVQPAERRHGQVETASFTAGVVLPVRTMWISEVASSVCTGLLFSDGRRVYSPRRRYGGRRRSYRRTARRRLTVVTLPQIFRLPPGLGSVCRRAAGATSGSGR